jgi:prepilin-type processing-associated H-X9-DG protein
MGQGSGPGGDSGPGPAYTWQYMILSYIKNDQVFLCPSNRFSDPDNWRPIYFGTPQVRQPLHYVPNRAVVRQLRFDGLAPLSDFDRPAEAIAVVENKTRWADAQWNHAWQPMDTANIMLNFTTNTTEKVVAGEGFLQAHQKMSNFLFADGHVKAMRPQATIWPTELWNCTKANAAGYPPACPAATRQTRFNQVAAEYR